METATVAPVVDHFTWYTTGHLHHYVRTAKRLHGDLAMLEAVQPAGDMSDPATDSFAILRNMTPGIHHTSDMGGGRFEERASFGALYIVPPSVATQIEVHGPHRIRCLSIRGQVVRDALATSERARDAIDFGRLHRGSFTDNAIATLFDSLWHVCDRPDPAERLLADAAILYIAQRLDQLAGTAPTPVKGGLAAWQIRQVTEAIAALDDDVLSLSALAEIVGLSPFHFCRAFKLSLGVSPYRYQLMRRIERARVLLETTDRTVSDIAFDSGYGSSQAFGRIFRAEVGVSPSDYRRERRR